MRLPSTPIAKRALTACALMIAVGCSKEGPAPRANNGGTPSSVDAAAPPQLRDAAAPARQIDAATPPQQTDAALPSTAARDAASPSTQDAQVASTGFTPALPGPLQPSDMLASSCKQQPQMTLCSPSTTPDIPGTPYCINSTCQTLGCGAAFDCRPVAPYFPWPKPGPRNLTRGAGDEPIVGDPITTLGWQGCPAGLRGAQCDQGSAQLFANLAAARSYCDALSWGGHDDWTLPDVYALVSLLDLGTPHRTITHNDAGVAIAGDAVDPGEALSRTAFPRGSDVFLISSTSEDRRATFVSTSTGVVDVSAFAGEWSAICMRRTQPPIPTADSRELNTKAPNGDQVMFDPLTRTLWAPAMTQDLKHADALRFCDELRWAGIDDWRLPDIKELFGVFSWDHSTFLPSRDRQRAWNERALSSAFGTSATYGSNDAYPTRCLHYVD